MTDPHRDDVVVRALRDYVLANGGEISSTSGVADFCRQYGEHGDIFKETLRGLCTRKAEVYKRHGLELEKRNVGSDVIKLLDDPARGESSRLGGEAEAHPNYRTKPCRHFEKGRCKHGDQCTFLHAPITQGGGDDGGSAERPADQRAPTCKFFAQGACQFGDRCRFRHDPMSSSAQSSAQSSTRSASGPRQLPTTQLKCTAEVVKLKRKADGAPAATAQPNAPTSLRLTFSLCLLTLLA